MGFDSVRLPLSNNHEWPRFVRELRAHRAMSSSRAPPFHATTPRPRWPWLAVPPATTTATPHRVNTPSSSSRALTRSTRTPRATPFPHSSINQWRPQPLPRTAPAPRSQPQALWLSFNSNSNKEPQPCSQHHTRRIRSLLSQAAPLNNKNCPNNSSSSSRSRRPRPAQRHSQSLYSETASRCLRRLRASPRTQPPARTRPRCRRCPRWTTSRIAIITITIARVPRRTTRPKWPRFWTRRNSSSKCWFSSDPRMPPATCQRYLQPPRPPPTPSMAFPRRRNQPRADRPLSLQSTITATMRYASFLI